MSTFYDIHRLTMTKKKQLFKDSKKISYKCFVDVLDCEVSIARKSTDMSFDEVMKKLDGSCHCVFIDRGKDFITNMNYYEVGFCTMNRGADYFLFLLLKPENAKVIIEKYELK